MWIFMKGTGCYILPNLQKFRPRNLRHTWTEEYPGTSSHNTSSNHPSGPCPLMCPEHRCQRSGPASSGLASIGPGIGLKLRRDTLLITCPNWLDTNYAISPKVVFSRVSVWTPPVIVANSSSFMFSPRDQRNKTQKKPKHDRS